MAIQEYSSERNIKIMKTLYQGIPDDKKREVYCKLYEIYHKSSTNFRFRMAHRQPAYALAIKEVGFTLKQLNEIENYDGTESTCKMMREMIDIVREYWK